LAEQTGFFSGVDWLLDWLQGTLQNFLTSQLQSLPVVGHWAARIATTVSALMLTVLKTLNVFLKTLCTSPKMWASAHASALVAWQANEDKGLLAQTYAYGRKMAGFFLEVLLQCLERAIAAHGLEMTEEEKVEVKNLLDELIGLALYSRPGSQYNCNLTTHAHHNTHTHMRRCTTHTLPQTEITHMVRASELTTRVVCSPWDVPHSCSTSSPRLGASFAPGR
jgi:hypothetical protein